MPNSMMTGLGKAFNHIDPEQVSNGQLYSLMYAMHAQQLDASREVQQLREELVQHKRDMNEISEAWKTTLGVLRFMKVLAAIGMPVVLVWGLVKAVSLKVLGIGV